MVVRTFRMTVLMELDEEIVADVQDLELQVRNILEDRFLPEGDVVSVVAEELYIE